MQIRHKAMIGGTILKYNLSKAEAQIECEHEAAQELTWSHYGVDGSGSLQAVDHEGREFYVIQYQGF